LAAFSAAHSLAARPDRWLRACLWSDVFGLARRIHLIITRTSRSSPMPPGSIWMSKAAHSGSAANIVDGHDGEMLAIVEAQKDDPPNGCQLRLARSSATTARAEEVLKPSSTHLFRDEISTSRDLRPPAGGSRSFNDAMEGTCLEQPRHKMASQSALTVGSPQRRPHYGS
jgi:hypothetical protein